MSLSNQCCREIRFDQQNVFFFNLFRRFTFWRILFYKSNRKRFSSVCIAWYKHSRGWENSRQLCTPSTSSRVCITVSNSPNPSRIYIRLCRHGKRFLLLRYNFWLNYKFVITAFHCWICKFLTFLHLQHCRFLELPSHLGANVGRITVPVRKWPSKILRVCS